MMRLPAGKYFVADPCYIIRDEKYDRLLEETNYFGYTLPDRGNIFIDSVTKLPFAVFSTAYGDGCYRDGFGFKYGVDAGCISCVPAAMVDEHASASEYINLVSFDKPFEVGYNDGLITFGHIEIPTKGDYDEYQEDYQEELDA
jgi:hypothetical protein